LGTRLILEKHLNIFTIYFTGANMKKIFLILIFIFVLVGISTIAFAADECDYNSDCFSDERCYNGYCEELDCDYNEIARYHKCVEEYDECDYTSDCYSDERCYNGECRELDCSSDEVIRNHRCEQRYECYINAECAYDQKCLNNYCITLSCSSDSYIQNHVCIKKAVEEPKQEIIAIYSPQKYTPQAIPVIKEESFSDSLMIFIIIGIIAGIILLGFIAGVLVGR
jgi:hypothetical protein